MMKTCRNVLITGGGRGIGAGIVEALAAEQWNLVFCGRGPAEDYEQRCAELKHKYRIRAFYVQADLAQAAQRERLFEQSLQNLGSLQALVNNAGVAPLERKDLLEISEESYDRVMNINLKAPFFLTQKAARYFIEQDKGGCIVNIGSVSARLASLNRGEYCISKAGLGMASQLFAAKMADCGVPVYEIRPGIIHSDMTRGVKAKYDGLINSGLTLQKRWGQPEDVGRAVAMLLRGDLGYSPGQVINVDGGLELGRL